MDRAQHGTFDKVMKGWRYLRKHGVEFNILCTVNAANEKHGRTVYRFFRDEMGAKWVQFIPIIERASEETIDIANLGWSEQPNRKRLLYTQDGNLVTKRSVGGEQYGHFLVDIFEEWVRHDVGEVYVQLFDVTLEAYFGRHLLCIHAPTCGYGPALEYNGDVYSCDHFVEPRYKLGNIHETHSAETGGLGRSSASSEMTSAIRLPRSAGVARSDRYATEAARRIALRSRAMAIRARTISVRVWSCSSRTPVRRCGRWPSLLQRGARPPN